jgi:hypothetical protein
MATEDGRFVGHPGHWLSSANPRFTASKGPAILDQMKGGTQT